MIDKVPEANSTTCFVSLDPNIRPPMPGQFFFVVTPPAVNVDDGIFTGAGNNSLQLRQIFIVTINSTVQLDQTQHDAEFLMSQSLGIYDRWLQVLSALSDHDLIDGNSDAILNEPIRPSQAHPERPTREIGSIQTGFEICYDVDLSAV